MANGYNSLKLHSKGLEQKLLLTNVTPINLIKKQTNKQSSWYYKHFFPLDFPLFHGESEIIQNWRKNKDHEECRVSSTSCFTNMPFPHRQEHYIYGATLLTSPKSTVLKMEKKILTIVQRIIKTDDNNHWRNKENKTKKIQAIVFKTHRSYVY